MVCGAGFAAHSDPISPRPCGGLLGCLKRVFSRFVVGSARLASSVKQYPRDWYRSFMDPLGSC